jgi:hypothetical protein
MLIRAVAVYNGSVSLHVDREGDLYRWKLMDRQGYESIRSTMDPELRSESEAIACGLKALELRVGVGRL